MPHHSLGDFRFFLKDTIRKEIDFSRCDQHRGLPPPPVQKPYAPHQKVIDLVAPRDLLAGAGSELALPLIQAINRRRSVRTYSDTPLTLRELSFLLWATQGLNGMPNPAVTIRTVPSAGARHALETYLYIRNVVGNERVPAVGERGMDRIGSGADTGAITEANTETPDGNGGTYLLEEGIYRYLPLTHQLVHEFGQRNLSGRIAAACFGQRFVSAGAATFFWAAIPSRMEWRYGLAAHRVIALDAGHVCQNLYLACEAVGAGTCAIGAYDQDMLDSLLQLDGEEEFVIYLAPVGKKP